MYVFCRAVVVFVVLVSAPHVWACPFCRAVNETVSDKLAISQAVVIARLAAGPEKTAGKKQRNKTYEVLEVLKDGKGLLRDVRSFEAPPPDDAAKEVKFVLFGALEKDAKDLYWLTPRVASHRAVDYLKRLLAAPPAKSGVERLAFFQEYLNDADFLVAEDAYDEIARAPFADVKSLAPRMHRERLIAWIRDEKVSALRRRQFLTMLATCGRPEDAAVLKELVLKEHGGPEGALDATVACYLSLSGAEGLPLIEKHVLQNPQATRSDAHAVAAALRFHGEEEKIIPRPRLLQTLRLYLDRPEWADQVLAELARWEDWTALGRLVKLFQEADREKGKEDSSLGAFALRVPIVRYLRACPLPEAKVHLAALEKSHPEVVRAADLYPYLPAAPKAAASRSSSEGIAQELLPPPKIDEPPGPSEGKGSEKKGPKSPSIRPKPTKKAAKALAPKEGGNEDGQEEYPVLITGLSVLAGMAVVFGLVMAVLFGFRPRAQ
jgi:hypothetical protein